MKNKVRNIMLSLLIIAGIIFASAPVSAQRLVGELTNFKLPAWQGVVYTNQLTKLGDDNTPWVLNIEGVWITVDTYLANSSGAMRSSYVVVECERKVINSTAKYNYLYHAVLMDHNSYWHNQYLNGSWSPDAQ